MHAADLLVPTQVRALVADFRPDYVVHLAGVSFPAHDDLEELYLSNILGTRHLLDALARAEKRPEHVILASSANVYGNQSLEVLHEELPLLPANDYGVSKLALEHLARIFADRFPLTVVRPFNYTGVGQSPSFLVPKIVQHFRDRRAMIELGNVEVARDFSDVRDVSEIYARLLGNRAAFGATLNICSGVAVSLSEVLNACTDLTGHRIEVQVNPAFVRPNEVRSLAGSAERLASTIGRLPRIPLSETLRWMLAA
jgi:nucleoside-diphosphate-sugar epimerase